MIQSTQGAGYKRRYGAYYTPKRLTQILCDWAIKSSSDMILEPGFGGCDFLESSRSRLTSLGNEEPERHIFGCDTDKAAFKHLDDKIGTIPPGKRFISSDFLKLMPDDFDAIGFDAVIGNPPYISMHNMSAKQAKVARSMKFECIKIGQRASLWAYFVIHALSFLRVGGRCAWVLPSSYVNADYAKEVHKYICQKFSKVVILPIKERLFSNVGAQESTVLVLADNFQPVVSDASCLIVQVDTIDESRKVINSWDKERPIQDTSLPIDRQSPVKEFLQKLLHEKKCAPLSEIANIRIGIVTGANKFFILNEQTAKEYRIPPRALKPILAKLIQARGLSLDEEILRGNVNGNLRCLLLNTLEKNKYDVGVRRYLDSFSEEDREAISTFKKRNIWHQPDDGLVPDAFLSYMCHSGPRLVLNHAKTTSTNTIHRIFFRQNFSITQRKLFAISLVSSLSQLSAELVGRNYGSGVLKLEPNEAANILVAKPPLIHYRHVNKAFDKINSLLESGAHELAELEANDLVLKPIISRHYKNIISTFRDTTKCLRETRKGVIGTSYGT